MDIVGIRVNELGAEALSDGLATDADEPPDRVPGRTTAAQLVHERALRRLELGVPLGPLVDERQRPVDLAELHHPPQALRRTCRALVLAEHRRTITHHPQPPYQATLPPHKSTWEASSPQPPVP